MCGRYTIHTSWQVIADLFELDDTPLLVPRYNVAPSQDVPVVRMSKDQKRELSMLRWGLVPLWASDPKIGYKMINAKSETLTERPAFREAYQRRRCLVVADGFYEWKKTDAQKQPYWIHLKTKEPFAMAGLWEGTTCTIVTTDANSFVHDLHDRMPVILPKEAYAAWLDPKVTDTRELKKWLVPYDAAQMAAYPVSSLVNSPKNDEPGCIDPADKPAKLVMRRA